MMMYMYVVCTCRSGTLTFAIQHMHVYLCGKELKSYEPSTTRSTQRYVRSSDDRICYVSRAEI